MNTRALPLIAMLLVACGEDVKDDTAPGEETGDTTAGLCPELAELPCEDDIVQDLLTDDGEISDGAVTTTTEGDDFVTVVDATAGGMNQAANNPWVYIRFDETGASRVDISDEDALESADWHMALRRYHVRLNGGDGGPSCVGTAKMAAYDYADLSEEPSGTEYQLEDFYDESCTMQMDMYEMSPSYAMYGWWDYDMDVGCVVTTMVPWLVQLEDGNIIKVVIEAYYAEGQEECNAGQGGMGSFTGGGTISLRWAML
jgi:hypothetical protein